jgi:hypothetical protein
VPWTTRCLPRLPGATTAPFFEAALWIAVEHQPTLQPATGCNSSNNLHNSTSAGPADLPLYGNWCNRFAAG